LFDVDDESDEDDDESEESDDDDDDDDSADDTAAAKAGRHGSHRHDTTAAAAAVAADKLTPSNTQRSQSAHSLQKVCFCHLPSLRHRTDIKTVISKLTGLTYYITFVTCGITTVGFVSDCQSVKLV